MKAETRVSLGLLGGLALTLIWLQFTPPGLLGKSDAVGYAVCHRIPSHSFHLGERPLSLCARCSGQYLGFLLAVVYQLGFGNKRAAGLPGKIVKLLTLGLGLAYLGDGINSTLTVQPSTADLAVYPPNNTLRFLTGFGAGVGVGLFFLPFWNRVIWVKPSPFQALEHRRWIGLGGAAVLTGGLFLTGNPLILYPLTLAAAGAVLLTLTWVYTAVWVIVLRRENQFRSWRELLGPGSLGWATALLQVAALDFLRYWLTGTWSGFQLG